MALAFLVLPVAAIFLRVPPGKLLHQLSSPVVTDALIVSVKTSAIAQALILLFGTPLAYLLASRRFRGRALVVTLVELPLVLPPAVAGLRAAGALRPLGPARDEHPVHADGGRPGGGVRVEPALHPRRRSRPSRRSTRTWSPPRARSAPGRARTFFRVVLPLARGGLAAGEALAFARGLGEFGATIMFAGSLQGVTQTLPLAIYSAFAIDFDTAIAIGALLVVVSAALLIVLKLVLTWQPSRQTSSFLSARST